jgi:WD40 repeat protein/mono/diheme cytochrome c family protein
MTRTIGSAFAFVWLVWAFASSPVVGATDDYAAVDAVFAQHCLDCHAAQDPEGKLVLESFESLMKGGESGAVILPGNSGDSLLIKMVEGNIEKDGKKKIMPPGKRKKLLPEEIAALRKWIDAGAHVPEAPARTVRELVLPKIAPMVPPRRSIQALAFAPGPKLIAIARYGEVELMSAESHSIVRSLKGHRGAVNALAFSSDDKLLAAAAGEPALFGEVKLWNVADGSPVRTFEGHKDALYAVAVSPDGHTLATGSYDQKIKLWELDTGKEGYTLSAHNGAIFDLAFRPDGQILASASGDRTVKLWNVATGKRVETLSQPLKEQYALAWSPDGKRLAAAGGDNRIRVWEVSQNAAETSNPLLLAKFAHDGAILNLLFAPDGKALLSSSEDRTLKLWDGAQLSEKRVFETQPDITPGLAFLDGGKSIAVGRLDGTVEFYDSETAKRVPPPAPVLQAIAPRGIQRGTSATLKLAGKNFLSVTNVVLSNPKLAAELLADRADDALSVRVAAAPDLPRSEYDISVAGPRGQSAKLKLYVDDLPQVEESRSTNAAALPVSFWGVLDTPGDKDDYTFEARSGQTLVLNLALKSVGSKIANGSLALLDRDGAAIDSDSGFDSNDRFLAFKVPADGQYVARVTDQMLGASKEHFYRLSVSMSPYVSGVFPLSLGTNMEAEVELEGFNLPADARVRLKTGSAGEMNVPIEDSHWRSSRLFKVLVAEAPQLVEIEPNDYPEQAMPVPFPCAVNGRIWSASETANTSGSGGPAVSPTLLKGASDGTAATRRKSGPSGDVDLFRFEARAGRACILETDAARRGSPVDTKLEVLHPDGRPVARLLLQAVRNTAINFRGVDSNGTGMRLDSYEEMELNEYLFLNGDVMRLFRMPQGPDSDMVMFASAGKRRAYFDTTAVAHALDEQGFIVEPHPLDSKLPANGLPVFTLRYENDDDSARKFGSDSRLTFTAPTNGNYLVRVTDTEGHGGSRFAYRLILREARPDFMVSLSGKDPVVSPGSGQSFTLNAERLDGFEDEIKVDITGLPAGFSVTTPILIQAGHTEAQGTIHAALDAPKPEGSNASNTRVIATASINGITVTREVSSLGTLKLGEKPKLYVSLQPYLESATNHFDPALAPSQPKELTIAPGQTIPAWLKIKRAGYDDLVTFFAENLPFGVIVADIGLNGVLIPKGESERQIFFNAAKWVPEQDRLFYMVEQQSGKQTSLPVLLKVRTSVISNQ